MAHERIVKCSETSPFEVVNLVVKEVQRVYNQIFRDVFRHYFRSGEALQRVSREYRKLHSDSAHDLNLSKEQLIQERELARRARDEQIEQNKVVVQELQAVKEAMLCRLVSLLNGAVFNPLEDQYEVDRVSSGGYGHYIPDIWPESQGKVLQFSIPTKNGAIEGIVLNRDDKYFYGNIAGVGGNHDLSFSELVNLIKLAAYNQGGFPEGVPLSEG